MENSPELFPKVTLFRSGPPGRRGFLFYTVLFILIFISLLGVQFSQLSRNQQQNAFRYEQNEAARQIAETAMEEAFGWFFARTADPASPESKWLTDKTTAKLNAPLAVTRNIAPSMVRGDLQVVLSGELRIVDFRGGNEKGVSYSTDGQSKEGHGTLEISIDVKLQRGGNKLASYHLIRHHDYLIVAMISPRRNAAQRGTYASSFLLDYVLFVRNGLAEFRQRFGRNLNPVDRGDESKSPRQVDFTRPPDITISIDQDGITSPDRRGKIYFGGTDGKDGARAGPQVTPRGNFVFVNISEKMKKQIVPGPTNSRIEVNQAVVDKLMPHLKPIIIGEIGGQLGSPDVKGYRGVFEIKTCPIPREKYESDPELFERNAMASLSIRLTDDNSENALTPGIELVSSNPEKALDEGFVGSILEGAIRKRFFYFVHFYVELTGAEITGTKNGRRIPPIIITQEQAAPLKEWNRRFYCMPLPEAPPSDERVRKFLEALPEVSRTFPGNPLISRFETSFLYGGNQGDLLATPTEQAFPPPPEFKNYLGGAVTTDDTGMNGFRPYNHFNLWYRKLVPVERLADLGILDPKQGIINLRGIIHAKGSIDLKPPLSGGSWKAQGQGVLIADNFRIASGIEKSDPDSLCVLFTRKGSIAVDTDQPVEAALIAINDKKNGYVRANRPMKLKGALVADVLNTHLWCPGKHLIAYDEKMKDPNSYHYQSNISRWITFQRGGEQ